MGAYALLSHELPGYHLHCRIIQYLGPHHALSDIEIFRAGHLVLLRKIYPYRRPSSLSAGCGISSCSMPPARSHPLALSGGDDAFVAEAVLVMHLAFDEICDRFNAAVRMRGNRHIVSGSEESKESSIRKGSKSYTVSCPSTLVRQDAGPVDSRLPCNGLFILLRHVILRGTCLG